MNIALKVYKFAWQARNFTCEFYLLASLPRVCDIMAGIWFVIKHILPVLPGNIVRSLCILRAINRCSYMNFCCYLRPTAIYTTSAAYWFVIKRDYCPFPLHYTDINILTVMLWFWALTCQTSPWAGLKVPIFAKVPSNLSVFVDLSVLSVKTIST